MINIKILFKDEAKNIFFSNTSPSAGFSVTYEQKKPRISLYSDENNYYLVQLFNQLKKENTEDIVGLILSDSENVEIFSVEQSPETISFEVKIDKDVTLENLSFIYQKF